MSERRKHERRRWDHKATFPLIDDEGRLATHNRRRVIDRRIHLQVESRELRLRYQGRDYVVHEAPFTLGRQKDCDIVVQDPLVSRHHARIERREDAFVFIDASLNGSYIEFHGSDGAERVLKGERDLAKPGMIRLGRPFETESDRNEDTIYFDLG